MSKKLQPTSRVLRELLETVNDLSAYDLVSKTEMARMKEICQASSKRVVPPVDDVCLQSESDPKNGRRHGKLRD